MSYKTFRKLEDVCSPAILSKWSFVGFRVYKLLGKKRFYGKETCKDVLEYSYIVGLGRF